MYERRDGEQGIDRLLAAVPLRAFAIVMATGIVSVAAGAEGFDRSSTAFMWISVLALIAVSALATGRAVRLPALGRAELAHPSSAVDGLAVVAALGAVAAALAMHGHPDTALAMLALSIVLWLVLGARAARSLLRAGAAALPHARGRWILAAISTVSISKVAALVSPEGATSAMLWFSVATLVLGLLLYVGALLALVARVRLRGLRPADVEPDWWMVMGGLAIAAVGGARILGAPDAGLLGSTLEVVRAGTLALWVVATALVPVLVVVEVLRLRDLGRPRYDLGRWGTVFPVGMYAVASLGIGAQEGHRALTEIGDVAFVAALALWTLTAIGLLRALSPALSRRSLPAAR